MRPKFNSPLLLTALLGGLVAVPALPAAVPEGNGRDGAKSYLVVDSASGHILAGREPDAKVQIGSLTKIATAIIVLDWAESGGGKSKLDDPVTVSAAALTAGGINSAGFRAGDVLSVRDLLYAMMLASDNVAGEVLAEHIGRSFGGNGGPVGSATVAFVAQMNALARSLNMERTRFLNPTGLDTKERPFSTAADLARLTRHAYEKASFRFIVAQKERKLTVLRAGAAPAVPEFTPPAATATTPAAPAPAAPPTPAPGTAITIRNTNELLGVKRIDGVKTGQTALAGNCLILSAEREKLTKAVPGQADSYDITYRRLIVVVLGAPDRFREGLGLIERGQSLYDAWQTAGKPVGDAKRETL